MKLGKANILSQLYDYYFSNPESVAFYIQRDKKKYDVNTFEKVTYSGLLENIMSYAHGIQLRNLGGKKIIILHPPDKEVISLVFAMFHVGAIPVFIDPNVGLKHLKACIGNSGAEVILTSRILMPLAVGLSGRASVRQFLTPRKIKTKETEIMDSFEKDDPSDGIAGIFYTSGSTGTPKGVVWTHHTIKGQLALLSQLVNTGHGSVNLALFPLFLIYGPLMGGATIWPHYKLSKPIGIPPKGLLQFIKQNSIDYTFGSPVIWKNLLAYCEAHHESIPNIRSILCGGAPIRSAIQEKLQKRMRSGKFHVTYGATEALPISYSCTQEGDQMGTLLGRAFKGVKIKIKPVSTQTTHVPRCNHTLGEVLVKGEQVAPGYLHQVLDTNQTKTYHDTGDFGYLDQDNKLWYYGRKKHAIHEGEICYYPVPIEKQVKEVLGEIACTIYVFDQKLFLILEKRVRRSTNLSKEELIAKVNAYVSNYSYSFDELVYYPKRFPVDKRHYSKVDRIKIQQWAFKTLSK